MIHKTRKHSNHGKGVYSIPELRRSFEHIEAFVDEKLKSKDSKDKISKDLRKEWMKVFNKPLIRSLRMRSWRIACQNRADAFVIRVVVF